MSLYLFPQTKTLHSTSGLGQQTFNLFGHNLPTGVRIPYAVLLWRIRLSARTRDFHSLKRGSTPLCATNFNQVPSSNRLGGLPLTQRMGVRVPLGLQIWWVGQVGKASLSQGEDHEFEPRTHYTGNLQQDLIVFKNWVLIIRKKFPYL